MTIFGYLRVSTALQADEGESLGVQQRQIEGWTMMKGYDEAEMIIERGVSGSVHIAKRPEGSRLWKLAKKGDTIVTPRLDRMFRSALDALQSVEEMRRRGVSIVVIDGLGEITGNGMAKAFLTISAAFAELERDTIRERVTTVKSDQRQRGRYLGGKIPFGFMVDDGALVADEEEQRIIARAKELRPTGPQGRSLRFIQDAIAQEFDRTVALATIAKAIGVGQFVPPSGRRKNADGQTEVYREDWALAAEARDRQADIDDTHHEGSQ